MPKLSVINGKKRCTICFVIKPINEFYTNGNYWRAECIPCHNKDKKYYEFPYKYKISYEDAVKLLDKQFYKCKTCGRNIKFYAGSVKNKSDSAQVDHNHKTGKVRGILCSSCNISLGRIGESVQTLINLAEYILKGDD